MGVRFLDMDRLTRPLSGFERIESGFEDVALLVDEATPPKKCGRTGC